MNPFLTKILSYIDKAQACSTQILYLSNSTKTTTNTEKGNAVYHITDINWDRKTVLWHKDTTFNHNTSNTTNTRSLGGPPVQTLLLLGFGPLAACLPHYGLMTHAKLTNLTIVY